MEKWAAVVRVSHMGERKAGSEMFHADSDQVAEIKRYAARHGAEVAFLPPELSVSGGLPIEKRPSLKAAIEGVEAGRYSGIVVANLKRLTRSRSGIEIWDRVEAAGGHVHCAAENTDTSTPNGRFIRDIHLADSVREREEHAVRFEARREHSTAAGIWQRRQMPRGYEKGADRHLTPNEQAKEVRAAFEDFLGGATTVGLAARLGMTPSGVRHLLRNRVYLGELRVGKHVNPSAHPPILDPDTFAAVQAKLARNPRPARNTDGPALLAGLVRCTSCGHVMTRGRSSGTYFYTCPTYHSGERCPRGASITTRRLDAYVEPIALAELAKLHGMGSEGGRVDKLREELRAAERSLDAYLEAVSPEDVGALAFRRAARSRREKVARLQGQLDSLLTRTASITAIGTAAEDWPKLDAHQRNALLRGLLAAVVVRPVGRRLVVPVGERARVLRQGAALKLPGGRGSAAGIVPIPFPNADDDGVIGVALG